jgi:hypothetical protein
MYCTVDTAGGHDGWNGIIERDYGSLLILLYYTCVHVVFVRDCSFDSPTGTKKYHFHDKYFAFILIFQYFPRNRTVCKRGCVKNNHDNWFVV